MTVRRPSVVLYGAGMISRAHGAAARFNTMPVVAVASRTAARATERAAEFGSRPVSYDDVLQRHVEADIAIVSTPPHCHARDAIALLDAGYAVLLEKPLCRTLAEADAIVEASARHHGRLLYAENLAYAPIVQRLITIVPGLGRLTQIEVRSLQGLPGWGEFTTDEWGGGALFDLGVHPLSVALLAANAAGEGAPTSVRATLTGGSGHGSDEHAEVFVEYASGLQARVESSWQHEPTALWDVQVVSSTSVLRADLTPSPQLEQDGVIVDLPAPTTMPTQIEQFGYLSQLRALADDVDRGTTPIMSASFGRLVLDVVCASYRSAGRGGAQEMLPFSGARNRTPLQLWRGT
jgi:myo-inositol 2-dehydrogenase / D-chiro-inositol 1-dehydrogenase